MRAAAVAATQEAGEAATSTSSTGNSSKCQQAALMGAALVREVRWCKWCTGASGAPMAALVRVVHRWQHWCECCTDGSTGASAALVVAVRAAALPLPVVPRLMSSSTVSKSVTIGFGKEPMNRSDPNQTTETGFLRSLPASVLRHLAGRSAMKVLCAADLIPVSMHRAAVIISQQWQ